MQKTYTSQPIYKQDAQAGTNQTPVRAPGQKKTVRRLFRLPVIKTPLVSGAAPGGLSARVIDGVLPALVLFTLTLALDLLIYPIKAVARTECLFISFFVVLAAG